MRKTAWSVDSCSAKRTGVTAPLVFSARRGLANALGMPVGIIGLTVGKELHWWHVDEMLPTPLDTLLFYFAAIADVQAFMDRLS